MTDEKLLAQANALLGQADKLIRAQIEAVAQVHPTPEWVDQAKAWRSQERGWVDAYSTSPGATRWRPIDSEGTVAPNPAPETPDDPDEGETGPAEVTL